MPDWHAHVRTALAGLHVRPEREAEIVAELVQHLDDRYRTLLREGATADDARRMTLDELTDPDEIVAELRREPSMSHMPVVVSNGRRGGTMSSIRQDLQFGLRMIRRNPGFSAIAALTLALGIGANGAVFSVVNALLLRELPYPEPQALVMVWESRPREGVNNNVVSPADFVDWRTREQVFDAIAAHQPMTLNLTGSGEPERLNAGQVSASFFQVLGVVPALGRDFLAGEEVSDRNQVVILNHGLWQRRFGGNPAIVGTTITLNGRPFEVIGVLPASFRFPDEAIDLWLPLDFTAEPMRARFNHFLKVFARLSPGVTIQRAQEDMDRISAQLHREVELQNQGHGAHVISLKDDLVGDVRVSLLILLAAVAFVLLIACVNVANLLLARGASRSRELAIRSALGAGRLRVVQQLFIESLCLGLLGGLLALPLAIWGIGALRSLAPTNIPMLNEAALDLAAVSVMAAIAVITAMVFSLAPVTQLLRVNLNTSLKERATSFDKSRQQIRRGLVVAEIALAFVLLMGAGLMTRSLFNLLSVDPGFDSDSLLTMNISLQGTGGQAPTTFFRPLIEKVGALPGVVSAGFTSHLPMGGEDSRSGLGVEGYERTSDEPVRAHWRVVAFDYFGTLRIRLREGRFPTEQEAETRASVAIINQTAAARYWRGQNPIGRRLRLLTPEWREIIGVVEDVRHWGPSSTVNPEVYLPGVRNPAYLVVRTALDPADLTSAVRREIRQLAPQIPLPAASTMEEVRDRAVASPRFNMILLGIFASVALVLAVVGVYGVMSYTVAQSNADIGLRMAMGAQRHDVVGLFVREGLILTVLGLAVGMGGAFALTRLMKTLLFGVTPTDPSTFAAIAVVMGLVALAASYVPARRAASVDPLTALKHE
jgi:putative ABC transport system permease protein